MPYCKECDRELPEQEFYYDTVKQGYRRICKTHAKLHSKRDYHTHRSDRLMALRASNANARARKYGRPGRITKADLYLRLHYTNWRCEWCGEPWVISGDDGKDVVGNVHHKVQFQAENCTNTMDNIVLICRPCHVDHHKSVWEQSSPPDHRVCYRCHEDKPATEYGLRAGNHGNQILACICKPCNREKTRIWRAKKTPRTCTACQKTKTVVDFNLHYGKPRTQCKQCQSEYSRLYRLTHDGFLEKDRINSRNYQRRVSADPIKSAKRNAYIHQWKREKMQDPAYRARMNTYWREYHRARNEKLKQQTETLPLQENNVETFALFDT